MHVFASKIPLKSVKMPLKTPKKRCFFTKMALKKGHFVLNLKPFCQLRLDHHFGIDGNKHVRCFNQGLVFKTIHNGCHQVFTLAHGVCAKFVF